MADSHALRPVAHGGWLVGFGNMAAKEMASWWRTRRALMHLVLWLTVINAFLVLIGIDEMRGTGGGPQEALDEMLEVFFRVGTLWATIGVIVATQDAVVGERQAGTAEWVLSKPITRPAFLLSKLLVNGVSFLFLAVLVPSVAFFIQTALIAYVQPPLTPFLAALALHVEHVVFYLAFALMVGTMVSSRGTVSGLGVGMVFAGLILPNFFPRLTTWLPWALQPMGAGIAAGRGVPEWWWRPVAVTAGLSVAAVVLALWRFQREEL